MLNTARVHALIRELESGNWHKGRSALRTKTGFCCQGVACEMAIKAGLPVTVEESFGYKYIANKRRHASQWPGVVREYFGFSLLQSSVLAIMNDCTDDWQPVIELLTYMVREAEEVERLRNENSRVHRTCEY